MQPLSNGTCGADGWAGGTPIKYSGPSGDPRFRFGWLLVVGCWQQEQQNRTQFFFRGEEGIQPGT